MDPKEFKDFDPKHHEKFSPNLFKRLRKHRFPLRVFQFVGNRFNGEPTVPGVWHPMDIWIGDADEWGLSGWSLRELIGDRFQSMGWAMHCTPTFYREITDEFWAKYRAVGRCAWDANHQVHFQNSEGRFTVVRRTRRCNWCGEWQHAETRKEVQIRRHTDWNPDQPIAQASA